MRRTGTVSDARTLHASDHACCVFERVERWRAALVEFVELGARRGERMLYTSPLTRQRLVDDLAGLEDRDALLAADRLRVVSHAPPTDSLTESAALAAEFRALVTGRGEGDEVTRVATRVRVRDLVTGQGPGPRPSLTDFAAFELLVDELAASLPLTMLCGLEGDAGPAWLDQVRFVHPVHYAGAQPHVPRDDFPVLYAAGPRRWVLAGEVDLASRPGLEQALAGLAARTRAEESAVHCVDVGRLDHIDVGGLRALVSLAEQLQPGGRLLVENCPGWLHRMVALSWGTVPGLHLS